MHGPHFLGLKNMSSQFLPAKYVLIYFQGKLFHAITVKSESICGITLNILNIFNKLHSLYNLLCYHVYFISLKLFE